MIDALKNLFARPASAGGAARRVLNVGGGSKGVALPPHFQNWEQLWLDIDPRVGADLVCDARALRDSADANAFDAVYCSHNLEHYYQHDARRVLSGFSHVLKDDGFVEIIVPDIAYLIRYMVDHNLDIDDPLYTVPAGVIRCVDVIYGWAAQIESTGENFFAHKTGFSQKSLAALLGDFFPISVVIVNNKQLSLRALAFKAEPPVELLTMLGVPPG